MEGSVKEDKRRLAGRRLGLEEENLCLNTCAQ
jgi:hypothetical protein